MIRFGPRFVPFLLLVPLAQGLEPNRAAADETEGEPAVTSRPPVTPVSSVDLERYAGLWHEIAKIPNRFQKQCARGTTAEYTLRDDGRIDVVNRCLREDGRPDEAKGVARIVDEETRAKLEVSFVSFLGWRPFWGDYWVIGLDEDYRWAIVGTPDRKYGWILARSPSLEDDELEEIFAILERNGYERSAFELDPPE
jgi:apolipoprotein D and lipocalin family protein